MPKLYCRYNKKHEFQTEEDQLSHERTCPDKKNRPDLKVCPFTNRHILKVTMYEKHIKNCKYKKQIKQEDPAIPTRNDFDNGWGDINNNTNNTNNTNINNNNNNTNKNPDDTVQIEADENYDIDENIFEEDDFIYKQCYV